MKDNFSTQSDQYMKYRPTYPAELFDFLYSLVPEKHNAWDCGTGNGQVAARLADSFDHVYATDISQNQLENAIKKPNISYSVQPAEQTYFTDGLFDLVVVAQAIHWFDFDKFYAEVRRTSKSHAVIAAAGYGLMYATPEIDAVIADFYEGIIGAYWDKERRYIDEMYQTIPFPFKEIEAPAFVNEMEWTFEHLVGYLKTWSAVKHYIKAQGNDPVDLILEALKESWGTAETRTIRFPVLLRVGSL